MQYRFSDYMLDVSRRELRKAGVPAAIEPQVFDLLAYLIQNRDRVVTKDDLIGSVWGGRIISDSTLTSRINAARRHLATAGKYNRLFVRPPAKVSALSQMWSKDRPPTCSQACRRHETVRLSP